MRFSSKNELFSELTEIIELAKNSGHKVIIIGNAPLFPHSAEKCIYGEDVEVLQNYCSLPLKEYEKQKAIYHSALYDVSNIQKMDYIEIDSLFCSETSCTMFNDDYILFRDSDHFNLEGSNLVGRFITNQITK